MMFLTLCLTLSLILSPALLTTPEKNDPNAFAPAVTLCVTCKRREKNEILNFNLWFASYRKARQANFIKLNYLLPSHTISNSTGLLFSWRSLLWNCPWVSSTSCTEINAELFIRSWLRIFNSKGSSNFLMWVIGRLCDNLKK